MNQEDLPGVVAHEDKLAKEQAEKEARIERAQVEEVFGLTGGELSDKVWEPWAPRPKEEHYYEYEASKQQSFRYWYEGRPEWASEDFKDEHANGVSYRTVVRDCLWGLPPEVVIDRGTKWTRVASYRSSGERECPYVQAEKDGEDWYEPSRPCGLCEAQEGEEHGYIYLGDGWCEVVYRSFDREVYVEHVDTCLGCYLTDHHNRPGEALVGITPGMTLEESVDSAIDECNYTGETIPNDIEDNTLRIAFKDELSRVDLTDPNEGEEIPEGADECMIWLVVHWNVDPRESESK